MLVLGLDEIIFPRPHPEPIEGRGRLGTINLCPVLRQAQDEGKGLPSAQDEGKGCLPQPVRGMR